MGKTLTELLSGLNEENIHPGNSHVPRSKLVKCSNCGTKIPVPGYQDEVLCQNCKTIRDANNEIITSGWYQFARDKTRIKKKIGHLIPAVHHQNSFDKTIDDRT